jgi:hypothetical protein
MNQLIVTNITFDTLSLISPLDGEGTFIGKYISVNIGGAGADNGVYKIPLFL